MYHNIVWLFRAKTAVDSPPQAVQREIEVKEDSVSIQLSKAVTGVSLSSNAEQVADAAYNAHSPPWAGSPTAAAAPANRDPLAAPAFPMGNDGISTVGGLSGPAAAPPGGASGLAGMGGGFSASTHGVANPVSGSNFAGGIGFADQQVPIAQALLMPGFGGMPGLGGLGAPGLGGLGAPGVRLGAARIGHPIQILGAPGPSNEKKKKDTFGFGAEAAASKSFAYSQGRSGLSAGRSGVSGRSGGALSGRSIGGLSGRSGLSGYSGRSRLSPAGTPSAIPEDEEVELPAELPGELSAGRSSMRSIPAPLLSSAESPAASLIASTSSNGAGNGAAAVGAISSVQHLHSYVLGAASAGSGRSVSAAVGLEDEEDEIRFSDGANLGEGMLAHNHGEDEKLAMHYALGSGDSEMSIDVEMDCDAEDDPDIGTATAMTPESP